MSGEKRRDRLLQYLEEHDKPVSGTELAKEFGVSRQVIVQDIALLRTGHVKIIATNRGYLVPPTKPSGVRRIFKCRHTDEQAEHELTCIVDLGGIVENVFVNHKIYGKIQADMNIRCRRVQFGKNNGERHTGCICPSCYDCSHGKNGVDKCGSLFGTGRRNRGNPFGHFT